MHVAFILRSRCEVALSFMMLSMLLGSGRSMKTTTARITIAATSLRLVMAVVILTLECYSLRWADGLDSSTASAVTPWTADSGCPEVVFAYALGGAVSCMLWTSQESACISSSIA